MTVRDDLATLRRLTADFEIPPGPDALDCATALDRLEAEIVRLERENVSLVQSCNVAVRQAEAANAASPTSLTLRLTRRVLLAEAQQRAVAAEAENARLRRTEQLLAETDADITALAQRAEAAEAEVARLREQVDYVEGVLSRDPFDEGQRLFAAELLRALLADQDGAAPWEGHPDPSSHGGHPCTPTERAMGYGTPDDPRFKDGAA